MMDRLRPAFFAAPGVLAAAVLLFGALKRIDPEPPQGVPAWGADSFTVVAWLGLAGLFVATALARRQPPALAAVALAAQLLLVSAGATLVLAVAAECQNYWDAFHFASLAWTFALAAVLALLVVRRAAALGSELAQQLKAPAVASLLVALLCWAWTWSSALQGLVSEIARTLYLATHG
tara:strand:- start:3765 stop:4298 length:534 start_codon:yes stop_codon:yes gene_type:complete